MLGAERMYCYSRIPCILQLGAYLLRPFCGLWTSSATEAEKDCLLSLPGKISCCVPRTVQHCEKSTSGTSYGAPIGSIYCCSFHIKALPSLMAYGYGHILPDSSRAAYKLSIHEPDTMGRAVVLHDTSDILSPTRIHWVG